MKHETYMPEFETYSSKAEDTLFLATSAVGTLVFILLLVVL